MATTYSGYNTLLPVIVFVAVFTLFNAVVLLIFWFSHTITSGNRSTDSTDFTVFYAGLDGRQTNPGDQSDRHEKQPLEDEEGGGLLNKSGGLYLQLSSLLLGSDSSSISESDEECVMTIANQAPSSTTEARFEHHKTSFEKQPQTQPLLGMSSLKLLQRLEENETAEFCKLLTSLKMSKTTEPNFETKPDAPQQMQEAPTDALHECLRFHRLVPIRRFDRDFIQPESSRHVGSVLLSRAGSKFQVNRASADDQ